MSSLVLDDVHLSYGQPRGERIKALAGASFDSEGASVLGLVGPNGAGKTSLARVISGAVNPDSGRCARPNHILTITRAFAAKGLRPEQEWAYLSASSRFPLPGLSDPVMDREVMGRSLRSLVLEGGRRAQQRVAAFLALQTQDAMVFSDEELGLHDSDWLRILSRTARSSGSLLVLVTHELDLVRANCDRVILLKAGKLLVSGEPDEVIDRYAGAPSVEEPVTETSNDKTADDTASREPEEPLVVIKQAGIRHRRSRQATGTKWRWLFRGLSASWSRGQVVQLAGDGLATRQLCRALVGSLVVDEGAVEVTGGAALVSGVLPGPEGMSVREVAALFTNPLHRLGSGDEFTEQVFGSNQPSRLDQPVGTLSSGERVRLALELGLATRPGLLAITAPLTHGDHQFRQGLAEKVLAHLESGGAVVTTTALPGIQPAVTLSIEGAA